MTTQTIKGYKKFNIVKNIFMLLSGISIFFMMLYITSDVILRNVFSISILHSYEISENYLMPLSVLPALAFAFGEGMMPRIQMIVDKFNEKIQLYIAIIFILIEISIFSLLTIFGFKYFLHTLAIKESFTAGTIYFPISYVTIFISISFLLVTIEMLFLLVKNIRYKKAVFIVNK